jgi:SAM-dependent methyltransferase
LSAGAQGELWSTDPQSWAERAEARNRPLFEAVLTRVALAPGSRLLDVGCGSGLACAIAVEHGAEVTGLDAAPGLLAHARGRVPQATFVHGDLEALPFLDAAFDAVTAFNVIPYADDRRRAIAEVGRVAAPGGRVAVTVGAGREEQACAAMVDPLAPPSEVPDWQELDVRRPGALAAAVAAAGLEVLDDFAVTFDAVYADVADAVAAQVPAGPVEAAVRHSGRNAVEDALRAFFGERVRGDGTVAMEVSYRSVLARR